MFKNQKHIFSFSILIIILLFSISYNGCDNNIISNQPLFSSYNESEAGIMMTLASLSYTAENNTPAVIKDSLILQLADSSYATRGKWELIWGPGISPGKGNMMYVAVDSTTSSNNQYTIAIRGTNYKFLSNLLEDFEVWKLLKYPYGGSQDSVALGSLQGLDTLLNTVDPVSGQSLQSFLNGLPNDSSQIYITGHSLGGALATMLTAWFIDNGYANKFRLKTYTFAAPSVGNKYFVSRYNQMMYSNNAECYMVVNSKDLVPYAWAGIGNIIPENIPTSVPLVLRIFISALNDYFNAQGIKYENVAAKQNIGALTPLYCSQSDSVERYFCWVEFEHDHNNYLRLLHADTVNLYKPIF